MRQFSELKDEREPWRVMYPLKEVLLLVTCATIASCDDFDDIVDWGAHHPARVLGVSSRHSVRALAAQSRQPDRSDPLRALLREWVAVMWPDRHEFIAIDGKTAQRTHDRRNGLEALQTLSATPPPPA